MPKRQIAQFDSSKRFHVTIPESLYTRLELALFSEVEGRIPYGALSELMELLIREHLGNRVLDLAPFGINGSVAGESHIIETLQNLITQYQLKERTL